MNSRGNQFVLGLTLIAVGTLFLLDSIGLPVLEHLWKAWPLGLIAFGVLLIVRRRRGEPARLLAPERVALVLLVGAGLFTNLTAGPGGDHPPPPPRAAPPERPPAAAHRHEIESVAADLTDDGTLRLDIAGADVAIHPGRDDRVEATLHSDDRDADDFEELRLTSGDGEAVLRFRPGAAAASFRLEVTAPSALPIDVKQRGGTLEVAGLASVTVDADGTGVTLAGSDGGARVAIRNGSLSAVGITGDLAVEARASMVSAVGVAGSLTVSAVGSAVAIQHSGGTLVLALADGSLALRDTGGDLTLRAARSQLSLRGVAGNARVEVEEGALEAKDVAGELDLQAVGATIRIAGLRDRLQATLERSPLLIERVEGPVVARGRASAMTLRDTRDEVDVRSEGAPVRIERLHGGARVQVSDGDVHVDLAGPAPVRVAVDGGNASLRLGHHGGRLDLRAAPGHIVSRLNGTPAPAASGSGSVLAIERDHGEPIEVTVRNGIVRVDD